MRILSGDIGGTKTWLQLASFKEGCLDVIASRRYPSHAYHDAATMVRHFLQEINQEAHPLDAIGLAVAGPIVDGRVQLTNLPWNVDEARLAHDLSVHHVMLLNDFHAIGYGIDALAQSDLHCLQPGLASSTGTRAIIGAGTGLGIALVSCTEEGSTVLPTEGGHVDFAPTDDTQMALLSFMRKKYHRVSSERLLSGQGLVNIYRFVQAHPLYSETPSEALTLAMHQGDPAAAIAHFATEEKDPMALRALDIFIDVYAAQIGNLALMALPYAGLYIVGGIAPKLLKKLDTPQFLETYHDKGRMSSLLQEFPLHVVLDTQVGLKGAALYVAQSFQEKERS